jgi:Dullard-like phosphatase family protein
MAASTSVSHYSITATQNVSHSMFVPQSIGANACEHRSPGTTKSVSKAFRLNVSRSSSAMKLPLLKPSATLADMISAQHAGPAKTKTISPVKPSKTSASAAKTFVLDKSKLTPAKLQYRKGNQKKATAVSIFDAEATTIALDTPPSNHTANNDPTTFSAAVTQLRRLPRKESPKKSPMNGQSTPQDRTETETTITETTTAKTSATMVTIKKRLEKSSPKSGSIKKSPLNPLGEASSPFSGEDYFVDLIRTCWSAISGVSAQQSKLSLNQLSEVHNYFVQNHKTMQAMKSDCIVERPSPIHYKRKFLNRKLLLLDLDETLIHCTGDSSQRHKFDREVDFINHEGIPLTGYLNVRPHTTRFLEVMSEHFEVVIFTASMKYYADRILKIIDPQRKFVSEVFYRDSCCRTRNEKLVKDLTIFKGIPLADMILVDNNMYCMWPQPENGIPVINFEHDRKDQELLKLEPFLLSLKDLKNHTSFIRSQFKLPLLLNSPTVTHFYSQF